MSGRTNAKSVTGMSHGRGPSAAMGQGDSEAKPAKGPSRSERPRRERRLEVRTTAEQDALLREAAELRHQSMSAFVLETATSQAKQVISEQRNLVLPAEIYDAFLAELDRPAEPVPELVELFSRPRRIQHR